MIRYDLRCDKGHDFDGWFRDSEGFETLRKAGQVACTHCGSVAVDKALMAPRVAAPRDDRRPAVGCRVPGGEHDGRAEAAHLRDH